VTKKLMLREFEKSDIVIAIATFFAAIIGAMRLVDVYSRIMTRTFTRMLWAISAE